MARRVAWAEAAWSDLEASADYIARDSVHYARVFVHDVRGAARSLREFATRGRVVPEFDDTSIRELFVRNHRLIYRVTSESVFVLGLVHSARDLQALWARA